jgi:two-component sensor histidine kinase
VGPAVERWFGFLAEEEPGVDLLMALRPMTVQSVTEARNAMRHLLQDAPEGTDAGMVLFVANELMTNAVQHGAGPASVLLMSDAPQTVVAVFDSNPSEPQVPAEKHRGMALVSALTGGRWGVSPVADQGKWVVATIPRRR